MFGVGGLGYNATQGVVRAYARLLLDIQKPFAQQKTSQFQAMKKALVKKYPIFHQYEGAWIILSMTTVVLKGSSKQWRKDQKLLPKTIAHCERTCKHIKSLAKKDSDDDMALEDVEVDLDENEEANVDDSGAPSNTTAPPAEEPLRRRHKCGPAPGYKKAGPTDANPALTNGESSTTNTQPATAPQAGSTNANPMSTNGKSSTANLQPASTTMTVQPAIPIEPIVAAKPNNTTIQPIVSTTTPAATSSSLVPAESLISAATEGETAAPTKPPNPQSRGKQTTDNTSAAEAVTVAPETPAEAINSKAAATTKCRPGRPRATGVKAKDDKPKQKKAVQPKEKKLTNGVPRPQRNTRSRPAVDKGDQVTLNTNKKRQNDDADTTNDSQASKKQHIDKEMCPWDGCLAIPEKETRTPNLQAALDKLGQGQNIDADQKDRLQQKVHNELRAMVAEIPEQLGWPMDVTFENMPERVKNLKDAMYHLMDNHIRGATARNVADWGEEGLRDVIKDNAHSGYYGPRGSKIIEEAFYALFKAKDIRGLLAGTLDNIISDGLKEVSVGGVDRKWWLGLRGLDLTDQQFLDVLLVPHVANILIMEDMQDKETEADGLHRKPADYGRIFHDILKPNNIARTNEPLRFGRKMSLNRKNNATGST
ncbi:unnamed protein product [Cyclocybe aegerita]|uniref:Restriction of telomere capping protein 4 C-terminal domain-containing protein n=1 Tax=Cyclocybe aegerita TaxID=1973307 RepID=A0A8S0WIG4_CYCAE|nr:unnamed protein product [Cyclocybe aegerita]